MTEETRGGKIVERKLSRRQFLVLAGSATLGTMVAACAPVAVPAAAPQEGPAPIAEGIELVGWGVRGFDPENELHAPYREAVMAHVNAQYPDVTLRFMDMGWDEVLRQNLVTALLAGTEPDLIVGENFIQPYAEEGVLMALDDALTDIRQDMVAGTHAAAVLGGNVYGVSQYTGCFGFERNPNVIEAAGLDPNEPPRTWSDLLHHAERITAAGDGEYYGYTLQGPVGFLIGGILRYAIYHKTADAAMCKDDCTYPYFDNPASVRVLEFLREIHRFTPPGLSFNPDEAEVYTQLFQGKSAYQIAGSWHVNWSRDSGLENAMYSGVPIPDEDGVEATGVVANVIVSVLSGTDYPAEAGYFCYATQQDDVMDLIWSTFNRMPPRHSALARLKPQVNEANAMFIDLLDTADLGILPQWRRDPQKIWSAYNDMITRLLSTEESIESLMAQAQAEVDQVMSEPA